MTSNAAGPLAALNSIGERLHGGGRSEEALELFASLASLFPAEAEVRNNLGVVLHDLGDAPAAEAQFRRALELDPACDRAQDNLSALAECRAAAPDGAATPSPGPDTGKVGQYWSDFFEKRQKSADFKDAVLWMDSPVVRDYVAREYFEGADGLALFRQRHMPPGGFERGVEIGCGSGGPSLAFAALVKSLVAYDVSSGAVELARRGAAAQGVQNVEFRVADANAIRLPEQAFDVAFFSHSLHHIAELEHVFGELHRALRPGGLIFAVDYMGPNRMQWGKAEYAVMSAIDRALPDRLRRCSIHQNRVRECVEIIPLQAFEPDWPGGDPSEGVRSADILPVLSRFFELVEVRPSGGTILHGLLQGVVHNFDHDRGEDRALLELMCLVEKLLIRGGALPSYFNAVVARRA